MSYTASTDNFGKIVNGGIKTLLDAEFPTWNIVNYREFREQDVAKRNEYLRYYFTGSEPLETGARYEARNYNYDFHFYMTYKGEDDKGKYENLVSDRWNHLYFYLMSNRHNETGGYRWHNIAFNIDPLEWGIEVEKNDETITLENIVHIGGEVSFWRTNEFEISELSLGGNIAL